jgi:hypothetical protein
LALPVHNWEKEKVVEAEERWEKDWEIFPAKMKGWEKD